MQFLKRLGLVMLGAALVLPSIKPAEAKVRVVIDISQQKMRVFKNGRLQHVWRVSTGRRGYATPTGSWRPTWMARDWHSRKYDWSPMPHSIFFVGGVAIHGTNYVRKLGRRASHGCVRLARRNAARLFRLVSRSGMRQTRIIVQH